LKQRIQKRTPIIGISHILTDKTIIIITTKVHLHYRLQWLPIGLALQHTGTTAYNKLLKALFSIMYSLNLAAFALLFGVVFTCSSAFSPAARMVVMPQTSTSSRFGESPAPASSSTNPASTFKNNDRSSQTSLSHTGTTLKYSSGGSDVPPLRRSPPRKICLMVEPTPFTHVSGYANRFKEMLKFLAKAGDDVEILTVDSKTPAKELPKDSFGYPIKHTQGFTFPLYNHISLTFDLPEMKGAQIIENMKPDLIHVTSP